MAAPRPWPRSSASAARPCPRKSRPGTSTSCPTAAACRKARAMSGPASRCSSRTARLPRRFRRGRRQLAVAGRRRGHAGRRGPGQDRGVLLALPVDGLGLRPPVDALRQRAEPHPDEVYAITAYILYSNYIVEDDFVLSDENFTRSRCPMPTASSWMTASRPRRISGRTSLAWRTARTGRDHHARHRSGRDARGREDAEEAAAGRRQTAMAGSDRGAARRGIGARSRTGGRRVKPSIGNARPATRSARAPRIVSARSERRDGPRRRRGRRISAIQRALEDGKAEDGLVWTDETLIAFLEDPRDFMKGTKMSYAGLRNEEEDKAPSPPISRPSASRRPREVGCSRKPPAGIFGNRRTRCGPALLLFRKYPGGVRQQATGAAPPGLRGACWNGRGPELIGAHAELIGCRRRYSDCAAGCHEWSARAPRTGSARISTASSAS